MKNLTTILRILLVAVVAMSMFSCAKELDGTNEGIDEPRSLLTRSITPYVFDWETVDYMPTPSSQSPIPVPWIGAGSLAGSHAIDVINDYKKSDGWRLLYSTFSEDEQQPLINPYFVLYNVYRGTMRVYLYVTTQVLWPSSYLRDSFSINCSSGISSNMLNFTQVGVIDPKEEIKCVNQIQPRPLNGGTPFASNKWYMMEYELAYDSNMSNRSYQNIQMVWQLDFCNVNEITLNGNATSSINSVVSTTSPNDPFGSLSDVATSIVKGGISIGSLGYMEAQKNGNRLGLSQNLFNALYNGINSAVSSISNGAPAFVASVFNSIIGGTTSSTSPIVSLKSETTMDIKGSSSESGSFPSMPISWYVPGTSISVMAQNQIPLENEVLGVIGWNGPNVVDVNIRTDVYYLPDDIMDTGITYEHRESMAYLNRTDFSHCIEINPAVESVADVEIVSHDVVAYNGGDCYEFPMFESIYDSPWESEDEYFPYYTKVVAMFIFKVTPKNGAPASYIYKTFDLDYNKKTNVIYHH